MLVAYPIRTTLLTMWIILQMIRPLPTFSAHIVELPILAAMKSNNLGVFEVLLLRWDQQPTPVPTALQWQIGAFYGAAIDAIPPASSPSDRPMA